MAKSTDTQSMTTTNATTAKDNLLGEPFYSLTNRQAEGRYVLENYLITAALFTFFYLIYSYFPYYQKFLSPPAFFVLSAIFVGYLALGVPYFFFKSRDKAIISEYFTTGHPVFILADEFGRKILGWFNSESFALSQESKTFLLKTIVKFFFFPTMVQFAFNNLFFIKAAAGGLASGNYLLLLGSPLHQFIISSFFLIDASIFATMYLVESKRLNNEIKSVEPTVLGWFVALNNYPPFNYLYGFVGYRPLAVMESDSSKVIFATLSIVLILLYAIYLWATFSLGWKAGNLVNRGIVSTGAYAHVRHPAYVTKNLAWWVMSLPALSLHGAIVLLVTNINYVLRALTEERHLLADPAYQEYVKRVSYRFIPLVF